MPEQQPPPTIRELSREECERILERNTVGRVAFSLRDRVDIQPIHYVYDDGWIYGRTSAGSKVATLERNKWLAFEVDEVDGIFDWRSVVVHGGFYILEENGLDRDRELFEHALRLLRRVVPGTLTPRDPVHFRTVLFRVPLQEVSGREAVSSG
jgi:nitroimidazol reductase NimA-like FMN-containing flavoprotein (pyridoxamine 5'-phosphate oxidase superfamily)